MAVTKSSPVLITWFSEDSSLHLFGQALLLVGRLARLFWILVMSPKSCWRRVWDLHPTVRN